MKIFIRQEQEVESLHKNIKESKRKWCQHLDPMPNNQLPMTALKYEPNGKGMSVDQGEEGFWNWSTRA